MLRYVNSLDDPQLACYRAMKDKELARTGDRFIAEGEQIVRRLLASSLRVESILVARRKESLIASLVPSDVSMYVADDEVIERLIGFKFHSGVLACGIRPGALSLEEMLGRPGESQGNRPTIVVCPKITNTDNLGAMIRLCAGFGVTGMLLGEQCCDPFFRHSVRVSMGSVFVLPMIRSGDYRSDLKRLRDEWGFELAATVISPDAQPLAKAVRGNRLALLFGSEADGLDAADIAFCDRRICIPMRRGTDSINVAIAAGIFLHHFIDECEVGHR